MKYFLSVSFILLFNACSIFNRDAAISYNNSLIEIQTKITTEMTAFANTFTSRDSATMFTALYKLQTTLDTEIVAAINMKDFDGGKELKEAGIRLFKFYKKTAENEYVTIVNILRKEEITPEDSKTISDLNEKISKEEKPLDDALEVAQNNLAAKYNFTIDKSPQNKKD